MHNRKPRITICATCKQLWQVSDTLELPARYECPRCEMIRVFQEDHRKCLIRAV